MTEDLPPPALPLPSIVAEHQGSEAAAAAAPSSQAKKKKGFKKCNSLALPKGMEKFMESIKAPMQDMESMMAEDQQADLTEHVERQRFHNVGF